MNTWRQGILGGHIRGYNVTSLSWSIHLEATLFKARCILEIKIFKAKVDFWLHLF